MPAAYHLVIVEDDTLLRKSLVNFYQKQGFNISAFDCAEPVYDFIKQSSQHKFGDVDLIVSDIVLPGDCGLTLFEQLTSFPELGKILISSNSHEKDRIGGLSVGADDYVCKPLNSEELLLRTNALLKRLKSKRSTSFTKIRFLGFDLDPESRALSTLISSIEQQVIISELEHKLLLTLVGFQGKICTRSNISKSLFNDNKARDEFLSGRAIDVLIGRLRKRFIQLDEQADLILTLRGKGYMLRAEIDR